MVKFSLKCKTFHRRISYEEVSDVMSLMSRLFFCFHIFFRKGAKMSHIRIDQASKFTPAVCVHHGQFHMVFAAANDTNELLHAVSQDGIGWRRLNNIRQSTKQAPAIASIDGKLVVVFVENNDTNTLLKAVWEDEAADVWSDNISLGESSQSGPALAINDRLQVYFIADNVSDDILVGDG
jgi:hypothetical protein